MITWNHLKYVCSILTAILILFPVHPAHAELDWGAKYAGEYMSGQSSARLLALGGSGVAIASGPSAILANPALLTSSSRRVVSLMHSDRFESAVTVDHINYVQAIEGGASVGLGLIRQGVDDIPVTRLRDPSLPIGPGNRVIAVESTTAAEYALMFAYSRSTRFGLAGATAKVLHKSLHDNSAWGLGVDIGYAKKIGSFVVGTQIRDALSSLLIWDTGRTEGVVPSIRLGGAANLQLERLQARFTPVLEVVGRTESWGNDDFLSLRAGVEYSIRNVVSARIGLDEDRLTYGAGLTLGPVDLSYAFIGHEDLGATHRISVQIFWGGNLEHRR
jgi:hypothetical protein